MSEVVRHTVLSAKALSIGYRNRSRDIIVGRDINFNIQSGELVALVGPNGVGKSTLLKTLAGMQESLNGSIRINDVLLQDYSPLRLAQQLSLVLTEGPASRNLSVKELVSLGRQPYTNWMGNLKQPDIEIIEFAMEATELTTSADKKISTLSDGQLQRVVIARALAQDTPLIILDEPTTHLDLFHRAYVLTILKTLANKTGKSILFSTHEIDLAIQLADRMLVMTEKGTFHGSPGQLIEAGKFDSMFPKDTIQFDKNTGRFAIKK